MDEDFLLAVQLQEQFDCEASTSSWDHDNDYGQTNKKRKTESSGDIVSYSSPLFKPEQPFSIVDESWETLDPSPDVRAMFLEFNKKFFYGKLSCVEVKWSPRMTLCAGVCSYEGRGGLCSIRLSEPLLKLRPRRDLVQTLLHEMIHALLFVTQNNRDRDGHGPEFCKHMNRINQASGTKITVYHTFHDEVDLYRQHWWRCDGPCQARKPFFGYVKRAMNRAPSDRDPWWGEHRRTCGGTYTKVKEPEDYGKKAKKGDEKDKKAHAKPVGKDKPSSATSGKSGLQDIRNVLPFSGKGFVLGGKSQLSSSQKNPSPSYIRPLTDSPGVSMPLGSPPDQSFAKDISWLNQSSPSKAASTAVSSSSVELKNLSTRPHPPGKKSVSNTKAFININGSPVRISGTSDRLARPFSNPKVFARAKQKSFSDLLHNGGQQSPPKSGNGPFPAHIANTEREQSSADMRNGRPVEGSLNPRAHGQAVGSGSFSNRNSVGIKSSSTDPPQVPSQRFKHPEKSGPASSVSRKRPLEGQNSAQIFDFFQRMTGGSPSARDTRQEHASAGRPPAVPTSVASPTVRCPVCQNTVPETRINDHLDSCLA